MPALSKYFRLAKVVFAKVFIVLLVLFLELAVLEVVFGGGHGMIADAQYRHSDRFAALADYSKHPSPTTKATWEQELRLMHAHEDWKGELFLALLIIANGIGFYFFFRRPR